jgi:branched-chain amino acid transport system ATP-binding protein
MTMSFEVNHLTVRYEGAEVLKDISFKVAPNEIVTLIGSNGAGKTTTLRTISGLKKPYRGEIFYDGRRIDTMPSQEIVKLGIIQVPQNRGLFPYMTVVENLRIGAFLRNDKQAVQRDIENLLTHFPRLAERKNQKAGTMSGGEQQMLAIAAALVCKPRLLLLDEPSIGLSPLMVKEIAKIIKNINETGTTILLVEQNARLALKISHRGYVMETGRIALSGDSHELLYSDHVKRAYLGG